MTKKKSIYHAEHILASHRTSGVQGVQYNRLMQGGYFACGLQGGYLASGMLKNYQHNILLNNQTGHAQDISTSRWTRSLQGVQLCTWFAGHTLSMRDAETSSA